MTGLLLRDGGLTVGNRVHRMTQVHDPVELHLIALGGGLDAQAGLLVAQRIAVVAVGAAQECANFIAVRLERVMFDDDTSPSCSVPSAAPVRGARHRTGQRGILRSYWDGVTWVQPALIQGVTTWPPGGERWQCSDIEKRCPKRF